MGQASMMFHCLYYTTFTVGRWICSYLVQEILCATDSSYLNSQAHLFPSLVKTDEIRFGGASAFTSETHQFQGLVANVLHTRAHVIGGILQFLCVSQINKLSLMRAANFGKSNRRIVIIIIIIIIIIA